MASSSAARRVLLLGAAGAGMQGLATLLAARGGRIAATDTDVAALQRISSPAFEIVSESKAFALLDGTSRVVYSAAVPSTHPVRVEAERRSISCVTYADALGELSRAYTTVAVTGTHGKSSTTAMLAFIAEEAGLNPTILVGAALPWHNHAHAHAGTSSLFIVEADEYKDHFLALRPAHAVITTIEFDHPDYFQSLSHVMESYRHFIAAVPAEGSIITSAATFKKTRDLPWPARTVVIADEDALDVPALPGAHMQHNARLAVAAAGRLGVAKSEAVKIVARFPGLGRRFETIGQLGPMTLISDYGHHPTEIAATLQAARLRYPQERMVVLVEPHTAARLHTFFDQFATVLAAAKVNGIVLYPTYQAREGQGGDGIAENDKLQRVVTARTAVPVRRVHTAAELADLLPELMNRYTVLLAFTAGTLDSTLREVVKSAPTHAN